MNNSMTVGLPQRKQTALQKARARRQAVALQPQPVGFLNQRVQRAKQVMKARSQPAPVSMIQETATRSAPEISGRAARQGDMRIRVRHREYIRDIAGSVAYSVLSLNINPGLSSIFPWLSAIANNFESYEFRSLAFEFRTEVATSTAGKVILSVDYDAADAAPTSKTVQLQERAKADGAAWQNFRLDLDQQDLLKFGQQRYVRSNTVASTDIKTYDVGILQVGTQAEADASVIGELYVDYVVELMTPQALSGQPSSQVLTGAGSLSSSNFLGTPTSSGSVVGVWSANTFTFLQTGSFLVEAQFTGTTITIAAITVTGASKPFSTTCTASDQASSLMTCSVLNAVPGTSVDFSVTAASVLTSKFRIAPFDASLG